MVVERAFRLSDACAAWAQHPGEASGIACYCYTQWCLVARRLWPARLPVDPGFMDL
jgi:hypothetical protein